MAETAVKDLDNEDGISIEDLQLQVADLTKQNDAMRAKSEELLVETKKAKGLKRESDEAARKLAEDKAKAAGDHEQLYKSSEEARLKLQEELNDVKATNSKGLVEGEALKLAVRLSTGNDIELIKPFLIKRLKDTSDGIQVTDSKGNLTISSTEELYIEFKNNDFYSSILKGNQSSGGGAVSGSTSGSAVKVLTRAEFNALDVVARSKFFKDGGSINH